MKDKRQREETSESLRVREKREKQRLGRIKGKYMNM